MISKSYSAYQSHKRCGFQYKSRYVDRVQVPPLQSDAASRGTDKHKQVELFLKGEGELDDSLNFYAEFFTGLMDLPTCESESRFAVDETWSPTKWDEAVLRGVMDLRVVDGDRQHYVYEFKTGKKYSDHYDQNQLYGLIELCYNSEIDEVSVYGIYLDLGETTWYKFNRAMLPAMKQTWDIRLKRMDVPESWIPNPGYYCRWCAYGKTNGGPCTFG